MSDDLRLLLQGESPLSLASRCLLRGLLAGLDEAIRHHPGDPLFAVIERAAESVRRLLDEAVPERLEPLESPPENLAPEAPAAVESPESLHPLLVGVAELGDDPVVEVVSAQLHFIDRDSNLRHVYRPLYSFGFAPADERFATEMVERLKRLFLAKKEGDSLKHLRARIDLDEAIHSLTYDPPPEPDSPLSALQQKSRDQLFLLRQELLDAGLTVHLQVLTDKYSEVRAFSRDDLSVDRGGKPGEVVRCLRVYCKIDQQAFPGRVLYRRL